MPGDHSLRFGTRIRGLDFDDSVKLAQHAEKLGFDMIVFGDTASGPSLEAWTLATAVAMRTQQIRVSHSTLNLPWRYPPFLAKMAASLDVISGGRLDLCVGAGGRLPAIVEEYSSYGINLDPPGERIAKVADFIHIAQGLWTQPKFTYQGTQLQVKDAVCHPKPTNGLVPIWVGALLPRLLRLTGELADGWLRNRGWPESLDEYRSMNASLSSVAEAAGRDPATIRRILSGTAIVMDTELEVFEAARERGGIEAARKAGIVGVPEQAIEQLREVISLGADTFIFGFNTPESMELFASKIIPALR